MLFDGGDCCLEIKDTTLCKVCSCNLTVDLDDLQQQFEDFNVKPLKDAKVLIDKDIDEWIVVEVEDVVSGSVCAVLCLDHNEKESQLFC